MKKNKQKTIAQAILASLTLAFGAQAIAQQATPDSVFAAYSANPEGFNRVVLQGKVVEIGERSNNSTHTKALKGFANDLPLITVLKQLTPNGWIVKKNDSTNNPLDVNKLVSWEGGKNWIETFGAVAVKYNLDFVIDWNNHTISISNSQILITPKEPKKVAVFQLAGTEKTTVKTTEPDIKITETTTIHKAENKTEEKAISVEPKVSQEIVTTEVKVVEEVKAAPIIEWHMISSKTLKENVEAWASTTNYKVRWTGKDYPVDNRVFTGAFDEVGGPIHQLSIDYGFDQQTGEPLVDYPLAFQLFQNGVLLVEDAQYEQPAQ